MMNGYIAGIFGVEEWRGTAASVWLCNSGRPHHEGASCAFGSLVLYPAIILSTFGGLVVFSNGGLWLGLVTTCLIFTAVGCGLLITRAFGFRTLPEMQLLIGATAIAYILALPVYYLHVSIVFPGACLLAGNIGFLFKPDQTNENKPGLAWFLAIAAITGFSIIWSLDSTARYALLEHNRLRLWLDIFIHAGTIAEFGDPKMVGRGSSALVDATPTFYHFASYALPGLMVRLLAISPADVIPAFWFPFGIFLSVASIFSLGRILSGVVGGSLSLAMFAAIPDAAAYGLKQGFFSFHWMMETSPGTLYALPTGLAAIGILAEWSRRGGIGRLALALCLLAGTFLLRAHIFMWLVVPFAVVVVAGLPAPLRRFRWHLIAAGTFGLPFALLWIGREEVKTLGHSLFILRFIETVHTQLGPTNYDGLYAYLMQLLGPFGALPFGLVLALGGMAGIWLLTFLAGFSIAFWRQKIEEIDWLPAAVLFYACVMMTLAPTPFHGDFTDFRQRAFVLIYVLMIVWTAKFVLSLTRLAITPVVASVAAILALIPAAWWMPSAKISRVVWGTPYDNMEITPGVIAAARWIQQEGRRGDSIAVANTSTEEKLFDIPTVLMGISGVPAYVSRPGLFLLSGPPRSETVKTRLAELNEIHAMNNPQEAHDRLLRDGIGFYVTLKTNMPAWDREGSTASLKKGDLLVWRIPSRDNNR